MKKHFKKVTRYALLVYEFQDLPKQVENKVKAGWEPFGSPSEISTDEGKAIMQAMVMFTEYSNENGT